MENAVTTLLSDSYRLCAIGLLMCASAFGARASEEGEIHIFDPIALERAAEDPQTPLQEVEILVGAVPTTWQGLESDEVRLAGQRAALRVRHRTLGRTELRVGAAVELAIAVLDALESASDRLGRPVGRELLLDCARRAFLPEIQIACARGLARTEPELVLDVLEHQLTEATYEVAEVATQTLAALFDEGRFSDAHRTRALDLLIDQTTGLKKAGRGELVVETLARSGDPRIPELLEDRSGGLSNIPLRDEVLRARWLLLGDESALPRLLKMAEGRGLTSSSPLVQYEAGRILLEGGHEAGYEWAERAIKTSGSGPKMSGPFAPDSDTDYRPFAVDALVQYGDDRADEILRRVKLRRSADVYLWRALALLERRDITYLDDVQDSLTDHDWSFLAPRMALALRRVGALPSGAVLEKVYERAVKQSGARIGSAVLSALALDLEGHLDGRDGVKARAWILKHDLIAALAALADEGSVGVLGKMLEDEDREVAATAALRLASLPGAEARALATRALEADYGGVVLSEQVRALIRRRLESEAAKAR